MRDDSVKEEISSQADTTVLFVDDEEINLIIGKTVLKHLEYKALTASNGLEALSVFKKNAHEINLIIMDINMPVMDGLEAIKKIREIDPQVKVLATSGLLSKSQTRELHLLGIREFLIKPYRANTVEEAIALILKS